MSLQNDDEKVSRYQSDISPGNEEKDKDEFETEESD